MNLQQAMAQARVTGQAVPVDSGGYALPSGGFSATHPLARWSWGGQAPQPSMQAMASPQPQSQPMPMPQAPMGASQGQLGAFQPAVNSMGTMPPMAAARPPMGPAPSYPDPSANIGAFYGMRPGVYVPPGGPGGYVHPTMQRAMMAAALRGDPAGGLTTDQLNMASLMAARAGQNYLPPGADRPSGGQNF